MTSEHGVVVAVAIAVAVVVVMGAVKTINGKCSLASQMYRQVSLLTRCWSEFKPAGHAWRKGDVVKERLFDLFRR